MRTMNPPTLWETASFGPLAAVAAPLIGGITAGGIGTALATGAASALAGGLVGKLIGGNKSSSASTSMLAAPQPPRPPSPASGMGKATSPFAMGGSSILGGTFVTGKNTAPTLGAVSGKKSLLGL